MKNLFFTFLFSVLTLGVFGQGAVRGKITDELGLGLPGANVFIKTVEIGTSTDADGNFTLVNVPAGSHELTISFIGYGSKIETVTVENGKTTAFNATLEPGVELGEEVLVLGDRLKGQAKALNKQKNNVNITNVVAADQIGRFPDANIGEAVKRIPGITMQSDQGEARNIIVRGLAPELNSVTLNGDRVPSAEGDNRRVQMDLIPADMIQTIEVNKAVTPDMDADAIGGSVNLVMRGAPSGLRLSGTAAGGLNFLSNQPIWTGSLIYGQRFADDKIGIVLSGSYNDHDFGSDNVEAVWVKEAESPLTGEDIEVAPYVEEHDLRTYYVRRVRRSFSGALDFKLNENNTINIGTMYNWRDDWENRYRLRHRRIAPVFAPNSETVVGYEGRVRRQTKGGIDNDRNQNARLEDQRVLNAYASGNHLFGGGKVTMDWRVNYAKASEERLNERYMEYEIGDDFDLFTDLTAEAPIIYAANPSDVSLDKFELSDLTEQYGYTEEEDLNARLDFTIPTKMKNNTGFFKFGGRVRTKTKLRDNNFFEYSPQNSNFDFLNQVQTEDYSKENFLAGSEFQAGAFVTPEFLGSLNLQDAATFEGEAVPEEYLPSNYNASENIYAGYLMWQQNFSSKFTAVLGARVEATAIEYTANQVDDNELINEITGSDNYTNILPNVQLKYNFTDNFILRAAWTNTIARPNYFNLAPYQNIVPDDEEVYQGNPNLRPTLSNNIDIMAENYFKSIGLVSGGIFYKDVTDFIYTFVNEDFTDPDITGGDAWTLFRPENGGDATLFGFEVAFQRQLDFLPGIWKGLGIYLNYTYTNSSATGVRNADGDERGDMTLPGAAPHMFNGSLSFETKKLVVRVSANYSHDYIDEVGSDDFNDRYYDRQFFVDVNASYAFTDRLRLFTEFNNLTNQPLRYYQGVRDQTMQVEYYNSRFNLGLKFDLFQKQQ